MRGVMIALTTWWVWSALALASLVAACRHYARTNAAWLRARDALSRERARQDALWERLDARERALHQADREDLYRAQRQRDASRAEARRWKALAMESAKRGSARGT
jgi:hypothetical protein